MSLLLETIKVLNKIPQNIFYHNLRMNNSRSILFNSINILNLSDHINTTELNPEISYKCRIIYDQIIQSVEYIPYVLKTIQSLKLVECNEIEYKYKFVNRDRINDLFELKLNCDDIIIIKNGYLTDSSYSNIALFDGSKWFTPSKPLLKGTQRQYLIDKKFIFEKSIHIENLYQFQSIKLFNSMIDWKSAYLIPISNIQ